MKSRSRSLLLKIEKKPIKFLIQVITQVLIAWLLSNFTCVDHYWRKTPIVFGGMKSRSRSLLLKIEEKKHIKFLIQVITQVLIAWLLSNFTCVDHHWRKTPIVFGGYEVKVTVPKSRKKTHFFSKLQIVCLYTHYILFEWNDIDYLLFVHVCWSSLKEDPWYRYI